MSGPPRWSERLLASALPPEDAEEVGGDLREEWERRGGGFTARLAHLGAVLSVLAHFAMTGRIQLGWRQHFSLAFRRLRREPTFSAVAITAIGLGLGVNVLMLAIAGTVLFAPLPYPGEDRLAVMTNDYSGSRTGGFGVSLENIRDVRERTREIESIVVYMDWQDVAYQAEDRALRLPAAFVSAEYPEALGLGTAIGRFFTPEEARPGAQARVVVLGQGTWQSVFGADPGVIGRSVVLNGEPHEVIGVSDDDRGDLRYVWGQDPVAVFLPLSAVEPLIGFPLDDRGRRFLNGLIRLREGSDLATAQAELAAISTDLARDHPRANEGWSYRIERLDEAMFDELRAPTSAILGISALVFVLVAVNLLTLTLLRAAGRTGEVAVRRALGASRGRVFAQLVAESAVLAGLGWALGLLLGFWGIDLFATTEAVSLPEFATVALDARVVATSAGAAIALAILLGLAPALALLRREATGTDLRDASRGSAGRGRVRLQRGLVAAEVAVAFVLLVGAGLLLESFRTLRATGYGFDTERLLLAQVDVRGEEYEPDELVALVDDLESAAERLPGAQDAFIWSPNRLGHGNRVELMSPEGRWEIAPDERLEASLHTLRPGTLASVGIPLLAGRDVSAADATDSPRVALLSEALARALWPGEDPLGRRIETVVDDEVVAIEVIGVVADARHRTRLTEPFEGQRDIYYPYPQEARESLTVAIRHDEQASVEALATAVRSTVAELSPSSPVYGVTTMASWMREEEGPARLGALLLGAYAVLAVALAALGLYGVLSHGVRLRLREIGIRMALGADRSVLVGRVVRSGLAMTCVGLVVGFVLAIPGGRLLAGALYGVEPHAPLVLGGVAVTLTVVAIVSCWIPAGRAVRVAPSDVLRSD